MKYLAFLIFLATFAVQSWAQKPLKPLSDDIFCPHIEVNGKPVAASKKEKLRFAGLVSGMDIKTYFWTVVGGTIIRGQGTSTIPSKLIDLCASEKERE